MANNKQKKSTPKRVRGRAPPSATKTVRIKNGGKAHVLINKDHTKTTMPLTLEKKLKKEALQNIPEKIVELLKPNTIFLTSDMFPTGVNGPQDLNWEEIAESVIFAKVSSAPQFPIPLGPAAVKAYLWWFLIDRLRSVGGLAPQPTTAQVPSFPADGALPVGWAKFVEHLMPYKDPLTGTVYQFKYTYTGQPTTTSAIFNPAGGSTDFTFASLQNLSLIPNPVVPVPNQENTWIFTNTAFNFITDITMAQFDPINRWISSTGHYVEAKYVPYVAPDASAVAVPYGHGSPSPGVYCQSSFFDEEMACIIHPPINAVALNNAGASNGSYFMIYQYDWMVKPLPQIFAGSPVKNLAANPNLASQGQFELIVNYGFVTQNVQYNVGAKKSFLKMGQCIWPNLNSYSPMYYILNLMGWHQAQCALLSAIAFQPSNGVAGGPPATNAFYQSGDVMTVLAATESIMIARTMEFAYPGLLLYTTDDFISQTNYGSVFRNADLNPAMADFLETCAPTVSHGRLRIPVYDYRNYVQFGYTYQPSIVNPTCARWLKIGTEFVNAANINVFTPLNAGLTTGFGTGPWCFWPTKNGVTPWNVFGPGTANAASIPINEINQGQTVPLPVTPVATNTIGPNAPCLLANSIIIRYNELYGFGTGTWTTFDWAKLGGYCQQTQITGLVEANTSVLSALTAGQLVALNYSYDQMRLGAYFPLDRESIGRSFAYATRISIVGVGGVSINFDKFPAIQSLSGNSATQNPLVYNTQLGPDSDYNKMVQVKESGALTKIEAVRSALGQMQANVIGNFSGDEYTVPQAIDYILTAKSYSSTAPYHTETSASLVTYNSPNAFQGLFDGLLGLGSTLLGGVGHLVGGILNTPVVADVASNVLSNGISRYLNLSQEQQVARKKIKTHPQLLKLVKVSNETKILTPGQFRAKNLKSVEYSKKALDKMGLQMRQIEAPVEIDYDKLFDMFQQRLSMSEFTRLICK